MKKNISISVLLISFFLMISSSSFAWIKIIKYDRGLFGYKYVNESHSAGSSQLLCSDPGFKRCQWDNPPNYGGIIDSEFIEIENRVNDFISSKTFSGDFVFNAKFYVMFKYSEKHDKLEFEILTIEDANKNGFI